MSVLFDHRQPPEIAPEGLTEGEIENFSLLDQVAARVQSELAYAAVWAEVEGLPEGKYLVRDARVLGEYVGEYNPFTALVRLQVLLLEGWRTPLRIWTDDPS